MWDLSWERQAKSIGERTRGLGVWGADCGCGEEDGQRGTV